MLVPGIEQTAVRRIPGFGIKIARPAKAVCKYCGAPLKLFQRISGAAFCCLAHDHSYRQKRALTIVHRLEEGSLPQKPLRLAEFLLPRASEFAAAAPGPRPRPTAFGWTQREPMLSGRPACLDLPLRMMGSIGPERLITAEDRQPTMRAMQASWLRHGALRAGTLPRFLGEEVEL